MCHRSVLILAGLSGKDDPVTLNQSERVLSQFMNLDQLGQFFRFNCFNIISYNVLGMTK